jgi:hypothetical protein
MIHLKPRTLSFSHRVPIGRSGAMAAVGNYPS